MPDLPSEVITEILSRLPPKKLLCVRCVSKSWKSQIDSSDFIHLHLKKSIESRINLILILRKDSDLFSVDLDGTSEHSAVDLVHPLMCYSNRIRVLGSCNGLLCISNVAEDIAYWNPSTRKHRVLPSLPLDSTSNNRNVAPGICLFTARVYGFGFDSVHNDYKLVRISLFVGLDQDMSFESQVWVYSSRKNFWKPIENMPYVLCRSRKMGVLSNGCLHWAVQRKKLEEEEMGDFVVAFNLVDEDFKEVSIPEECKPSSRCEIDVGVLDENLCLIANYREQQVQIRVEVLMMKEYGVKESWTKLFTISSQPDVTIRSSNYVKPLAYSNTGTQVLLEKGHKLVWYDFKSQQIENVKFHALPHNFDAGICVGSLVSPNICRDDDWKKQQSLHDKKSKKRDDFLSEGFKLVL